jgi:hypothetical protein
VYVTIAGQGILALNTHEAAAALLDGRGVVYANRPRFTSQHYLFAPFVRSAE